jgi:hypothetical protein
MSVHHKDGNKKFSHKEFRTMMTGLGEKLSDEQVDEVIREIDTDGDGQIDHDEFIRYCTLCTLYSLCTHCALTVHSLCTHCALTMHSLCTHN